nr:hypothetical protein CFP56_67378 [Quercus suber]
MSGRMRDEKYDESSTIILLVRAGFYPLFSFFLSIDLVPGDNSVLRLGQEVRGEEEKERTRNMNGEKGAKVKCLSSPCFNRKGGRGKSRKGKSSRTFPQHRFERGFMHEQSPREGEGERFGLPGGSAAAHDGPDVVFIEAGGGFEGPQGGFAVMQAGEVGGGGTGVDADGAVAFDEVHDGVGGLAAAEPARATPLIRDGGRGDAAVRLDRALVGGERGADFRGRERAVDRVQPPEEFQERVVALLPHRLRDLGFVEEVGFPGDARDLQRRHRRQGFVSPEQRGEEEHVVHVARRAGEVGPGCGHDAEPGEVHRRAVGPSAGARTIISAAVGVARGELVAVAGELDGLGGDDVLCSTSSYVPSSSSPGALSMGCEIPVWLDECDTSFGGVVTLHNGASEAIA